MRLLEWLLHTILSTLIGCTLLLCAGMVVYGALMLCWTLAAK